MARKKGCRRKATETSDVHDSIQAINVPKIHGEPHTSSLREESDVCPQNTRSIKQPPIRQYTPSSVDPGGFFGGANGISINGGTYEQIHGDKSNYTINLTFPRSQEIAGQQHQLRHSSTSTKRYAPVDSNTIYQKSLGTKGRGTPLRNPTPGRNLPIAYQRKGVDIGDVGIITPDGGFSFLFNICLPADHSINPPTLPDGFTPIQPPIERMDIREEVAFNSGSHLASGIKAVDDPQISGLSFVTEAAEGAILTMPDGAISRELENFLDITAYMAAHIESWYRYANVIRGRDVKNGDIRVVYGCDKATSWGMATFANMTEHEVHHLKYRMIANGGGTSTQIPLYKWEQTGSTETRVGPEPREMDDLKRGDNSDVAVDGKYWNQTLFIRTLNVRVKDDVFAEIEQEVEAGWTQKSQQYRNRGSSESSSSIPSNTVTRTVQPSDATLVNQTGFSSSPAQNLPVMTTPYS